MRLALATLAAAVLVFAAPAAADEATDELALLQERDAQLFATGWRLARANAPFCERTVNAIGMLAHDVAAYSRPEEVQAALGLSGEIGVQAVAPDSPAQAAGIESNGTLSAIGGIAVDRLARTEPSWQRLTYLNDAIDRELARGLPVAVGWTDAAGEAHSASIAGVPVCSSRFEVQSSGSRALAEGTRVIFGRDFPGFSYPQDEFAAAVAHELAHNLLGHRVLLDVAGRPRELVRLTERDADRLMPWLLYNAGYDPGAAIRFMQRWGPEHGGGLLRKRTHDGWDERVEFIAAEIERLRAIAVSSAPADWSRHFVAEARSSDPD